MALLSVPDARDEDSNNSSYRVFYPEVLRKALLSMPEAVVHDSK